MAGTQYPGIPGYDPIATREDCVFDPWAADRACRFFPSVLKHVEGDDAGKPFELQPWQRAVIANLFGWFHPNGRRRYRECLIYVPRKNGKTTLAAGIALYMLVADGEAGAKVFSIAAAEDQAAIVFDIGSAMVEDSPPSFRKLLRGYRRSIRYPSRRGVWKVLASDAKVQHGANASALVADELHAMKTRELLDVMMTSTGARKRSLTVHLTTADYERPGSVCNQKHDYASRIRDGVLADVAFLPVIWQADKKGDWTSGETWKRANPNYGVSLDPAYMDRECKKAIAVPAELGTFLRLHLNIRTEQAEAWIPMDQWKDCSGDMEEPEYAELWAYAGLDLSATTDVTALVLLWPANGLYVVKAWFWMPEDTLADMKGDYAESWRRWVRDGHVQVTPGGVVDYAFIRRKISGASDDGSLSEDCLHSRYPIKEIAIDFGFQAAYLATQLQNDGLTIVPHRMSFQAMTTPCHRLEILLAQRALRHGGNPVLDWMASNVSVKRDEGGRMHPRKQAKGGQGKIDGIVALLLALSRADVHVDGATSRRIIQL